MPRVKPDAIWPTPEEDVAIRVGIEADPDNYEADSDWFASARPAVEVHPDLVKHWRRTRAKQSTMNEKTVLQKFKDAFPLLCEETKGDNTIVFRHGASVLSLKLVA